MENVVDDLPGVVKQHRRVQQRTVVAPHDAATVNEASPLCGDARQALNGRSVQRLGGRRVVIEMVEADFPELREHDQVDAGGHRVHGGPDSLQAVRGGFIVGAG